MKAHRLFATIIWLTGFCVNMSAQAFLPDNMVTADCVAEPSEQQWGIVEGSSSPPLSHMYAQPFIGDIDNDGQSEIVTVGYYDSPGRSSSLGIAIILLCLVALAAAGVLAAFRGRRDRDAGRPDSRNEEKGD